MDDLKIIFYIVVTILWFFYNNYRKVQKKARERDITESPGPIENEQDEPFDWEREFFPSETQEKKPEPLVKELTTRELQPPNTELQESTVPKSTIPASQNDLKSIFDPSKLHGTERRPEKVISRKISARRQKKKKPLYDLKGTNWKKAVIISEVLNPPYL